MPQYANSRQVGYTAWSDYRWGSFMNSYAATPFNTSATTGMGGVTFFGQWSISAPWSGTYTMRAAADDFGSCNMGGNTFGPGDFVSGGNTTSKYFSKGQTIIMQWSIGNSSSPPNGPDFASNPCAIAWTLDGPSAPPYPSVSLYASTSSIIQGNCASLSWSASGVGLYYASLTGVSYPGYGGSASVCPSSTTTYTYYVCGERGCSIASRTITVYIPPNLNISINPTAIIAGQSSTLSWSTSGDANSIVWNSGNVTNYNLTSSSTVSPLDTTTYSATVSGLGGSDTDSIVLTVYQPVTIDSLNSPTSLDYGQQGTVSYQSSYCNTGLNMKIYYRYTDSSDSSVLAYDYNLPTASSSQLNAPNTVMSGDVNLNIVYDDFGPRFIDIVLTASGDGGTATRTAITTINIDETPDFFIIPEKEDAYKDEDPVFAPDLDPETAILSDMFEINDIDIPVEIKSNYPIQVDINNQNDWKNLRQI